MLNLLKSASLTRRRIVSLSLAAFMLFAAVGCTQTEPAGSEATGASAAPSAGGASASASAGPADAGEYTYPIPGNKTLTINMDPLDMSAVPEWALDHYFWDEMQRRTGITLEFVGGAPNTMTVSEQFTLMLASMDYPDLFKANWLTFPGGPNAAMGEGYIIPLNDYAGHMPNFMAALEKEPQIKKDIITDDGTLYNFPYYAHDRAVSYTGLLMRKDWLDQLNLPVPETIGDVYTALTAFKNELGVVSPLTFEYRWLFLEHAASSLSSPYGVCYPFYVKDGTVKFGPLEAGFKDFLLEMNKWYTEGLIDRDMPSVNKATVEAKISSGESGLGIMQATNTQNVIMANRENPDYEVIGLKTLVKNVGDERSFGQLNNNYSGANAFSISTQCEDIETAIRFCDYFWGEEGRMLCEYGTEDVSYVVNSDGTVALSDLVINNPDNLPPRQVREFFAMGSGFAYRGTDFDLGYEDSLLAVKEQQTDHRMWDYIMPPVLHTTEESAYVSSNYGNIDTYCQEMVVKFIIGTESFDNYDAFLETIQSYGIDQILEYKQAAYERYQAR